MARPHALIGRWVTRQSLYPGLRARGLRTSPSQKPIRAPTKSPNSFWTLGIETSCDDTCVSILQTDNTGRASITWNARLPCANRKYEGIHPLEAVESHTRNLPKLISQALTRVGRDSQRRYGLIDNVKGGDAEYERTTLFRPDLIAVTRGPGMKACLSIGISMAKALSVGLQVPLIGVHHMQAHALTPQMETAIASSKGKEVGSALQYPFLTLLVSGGHTMLLHTTSSIDHRILASTQRGSTNPREKESPVAIGDMLDKCARVILPEDMLPEHTEAVVYAKLMEAFVKTSKYDGLMNTAYAAPEKRQDEIEVYESEAGWAIPPPLRLSRDMKYDFSGLGGMVRSIMQQKPDMSRDERAELAYQTMRIGFEHLASRVILALQNDAGLLKNPPKHLVLSGGVASNKFLCRVLEGVLQARGFGDIKVTAPSPFWCTDNAAMIAWAGAEMFQSGWTTDVAFLPKSEWPIEQIITDTDCWIKGGVLHVADQGSDKQDMGSVKAAAAKAPAESEPDAASKSPAAETPSENPSPTKEASPDGPVRPTQEGRRKKRRIPVVEERSSPKRQEQAEISTLERLQRIQQRVRQLLGEDTAKAESQDGPPPTPPAPKPTPRSGLQLEPETEPKPTPEPETELKHEPESKWRLVPARAASEHLGPVKPRPGMVKRLNLQVDESAQDDLVAAERQLGGSWTQATPFPQSSVPPQSAFWEGRPLAIPPARTSTPIQQQQQQIVGDRKRSIDSVGDKVIEQPKAPWEGPVNSSMAEVGKSHIVRHVRSPWPPAEVEKPHIVRRIRPVQPPREAEPSGSPAMAIQKGLSALKRWAGL